MLRVKKSVLNDFRPLLFTKAVSNTFANDATKIVATIPPSSPVNTDVLPPTSPAGINTEKQNVNTPIADVFVKVEMPQAVADPQKPVPFDDVPGPTILKQIAKFWKAVPVVGSEVTASTLQYILSAGKMFGNQLTWGSNLRIFKWMLNEYGPVVRLSDPFGGDVVILSRPEHVRAIFQSEGSYPVRSCLDSVEKYRINYRRYKFSGPFSSHGPEWEKMRKSLQRPLHEATLQRFDRIETACDDFTVRISRTRNRQEEVGDNFKNEIYKWALECLCSVTLNRKIGFLEPMELSVTSEPYRLFECLMDATDAIRRCEHGPHLWKFIETPAWKTLVRNCDVLDGIINKHILRAQENLTTKKNPDLSLMEHLLSQEGVIPEDVLTLFLDMLLIGVNATTHAVSFLFYHLARFPRVQRKLYEEVKANTGKTCRDKVPQMQYLNACIKESLRLKPPMPVLSRLLTQDVIVHNYMIPKGTYVLIATHLASLREEHFEDAEKFYPERWLTPHAGDGVEAFACIPFGYGRKSCLAKEMAEMQIGLLLCKVLEKYRIEYHYGDINSNHKLLAQPDKPLKFRFVNRV